MAMPIFLPGCWNPNSALGACIASVLTHWAISPVSATFKCLTSNFVSLVSYESFKFLFQIQSSLLQYDLLNFPSMLLSDRYIRVFHVIWYNSWPDLFVSALQLILFILYQTGKSSNPPYLCFLYTQPKLLLSLGHLSSSYTIHEVLGQIWTL